MLKKAKHNYGAYAPNLPGCIATGKTLKEYKGTETTQEFVFHQGLLFVVIGDRMTGQKGQTYKIKSPEGAFLTFKGHGFPSSAYNPQTHNVKDPANVIVAINAETGMEIWRSKKIKKYTGCSLALKGDNLVYQSANGVVCLDAGTGKENWAVKKELEYGKKNNGSKPNTLVLGDDAVYSEEGENIYAYALTDGSDYWEKSIPTKKGFHTSTDMLIAQGVLWLCGEGENKGDVGGRPTSYDLKTGNQIKVIPQKITGPQGHDRCYRNYITERFFINSKTGGSDFLDLVSDNEYPGSFLRGTCSMGVLPCNGLLYAGPDSCQCHIPVSLQGFNAFYTDEDALRTKGQAMNIKQSTQFEKGPAYGYTGKALEAPWPTYRQDSRRYSGIAKSVPATGLKQLWQAKLRSPVSAPVIADGKVFLTETDAHTLHALNADSGKLLWNYITGGRIDSSPTYYKGLLLFGSRDGWMHCIRASDGALSWRFKDLPDKLICALGQVESAWPVSGSVLLKNDVVYFCAGRSSYLDGGLFIYGLDPVTGKVLHQRQFYGPYGDDGFPMVSSKKDIGPLLVKGTIADLISCEGDTLYIKSQPFNLDLTDAKPGKHLLSVGGLLESSRAHREYAIFREHFTASHGSDSKEWDSPNGDLIVSDGKDYYSFVGMEVSRHTYFHPVKDGYSIIAKTRATDGWTKKWEVKKLPLTGKAMILAGDTIFVAGAPLVFKVDDLHATYEGRLGGILLAVSPVDGSKLVEYKLDVLPAWDGMAAANGKLYISSIDGTVTCME